MVCRGSMAGGYSANIFGKELDSPKKREMRIKKKNLPMKKIQAIHFPKSCQL